MAKLTIDLKANPDVADLVAAMQVGEKVRLDTTIQAKDDQTLTLTLDEASEGEKSKDESEDSPDADEADDDSDDE